MAAVIVGPWDGSKKHKSTAEVEAAAAAIDGLVAEINARIDEWEPDIEEITARATARLLARLAERERGE